MKNLKRISYLCVSVILISVGFISTADAQDRQRVVKTISSQPTNLPTQPASTATDKTKSLSSSSPANSPAYRPTLTNKIVVIPEQPKQPLVKKTGSSSPLNAMNAVAGRMAYNASATSGIIRGIQSRLGIPYLYGSSGPNRYDCSGFVWSVFNEAGIHFTRSSARNLWASSEPVTGDDRFKFGTLVFLNGLGHMGIVADENGFYHASSSKGITYSPFKGYWEKRLVGFRRLPQTIVQSVPTTIPSVQ
ncbi:MAG: C40 family peptidase [Saprospiraceae bacterium]|nr:C40 family peptidase [Pyrinomonadaceae bacterium]